MGEPQPIVVALAAEGVPIRAIARITKIAPEDLYEQLEAARTLGYIVNLPRADWQGAHGQNRPLNPVQLSHFAEEDLIAATMRVFGLTPCMARIMLTFIRLPGSISHERMHEAYNTRGNEQVETEPKVLDVQCCKMRKRLKKVGIAIVTEWGYGKRLSPDDRLRALKMLMAALP